MTSLSLLFHYSIIGKQGKKKAFSVHRFLHFFIVLGLNLNDGKVTWMSYISNMQGKGIFKGLLIPPGLKRDVSHGCAPFQAICSLERRKKSRRRRRGSPHKPNSLSMKGKRGYTCSLCLVLSAVPLCTRS